MDFSDALREIKSGRRMTRRGWNAPGQFVFHVPGSTFRVNRPPLLGIYESGTEVNYHDHVDLRTAQGQIVPWTPTQGDLFASDWEKAG